VTTAREATLSAVIIARNESAHIVRCIESVMAAVASIDGCEIVLVDSCSDDRTVEIARRYPIRVIELARNQRCCAAMGRHVGIALTRGEYVLCVDGDTEIHPDWATAALAVLSARPNLGGAAGREDQIYYRNGERVGGKPDYFETGDAECVVDQFGGNAMYRRRALESVGSFNPYVRSFEEAELGARLRRAGWQLVRIPASMGNHHTQQPDSLREYRRRLSGHLFTGQGQVLRIALRQGLFWEHARKLNRVLLFWLWVAIGGATAGVAVTLSRRAPAVMWLAASGLLIVAFVIRTRSVAKPLRLMVDWALSGPPLVWGFLLAPADPRAFRLEDAVASDQRISLSMRDSAESSASTLQPIHSFGVFHGL